MPLPMLCVDVLVVDVLYVDVCTMKSGVDNVEETGAVVEANNGSISWKMHIYDLERTTR